MYGYNGKILRVCLSTEKLFIEKPDYNFYRRYFGGWGVITYYLLKELKPGDNPLGPENKLIFASGVITGAPIPGSCRNAVGGKSPLTGGIGLSEAGGFFGAELKYAGFDAIIVEGKAKKPVYLWIQDGVAEIRDASHLWGKDIGESQALIREDLDDNLVRTAQIGLGGENLVRYACIINDLRSAAGRCGMGAVMGSKKLKAVAIRGHKKPELADHEKLFELTKWISDRLQGSRFKRIGTGGDMEFYRETGNLPTHNWRDGEFPYAKDISAQTIEKRILSRMESCYACPLHCKKVLKQIDEPYVIDPQYGGPEYETIAALGSNCDIGDLFTICKAHELCNRYTLDTISTGGTISFAMECYENGLLTKKDTGGINLSFGNSEAMLQVIEMIAKRQGIGDLLAEGSMLFSKRIGKSSEPFTICVKGQELPMHDPRIKRTIGLGYAVSPTGADHNHNFHDTGIIDPIDFEDAKAIGILEKPPLEDFNSKKVRILIYITNWRVLNNCEVLCHFTSRTFKYHHNVEIIRAVTGWNSTSIELAMVGERAINLARVFNIREGFTEKDDWLPARMFQPQTSGPLFKTKVNPKNLEALKHTYYGMMGWDRKTGIPTREKLEELDISWVADELPK